MVVLEGEQEGVYVFVTTDSCICETPSYYYFLWYLGCIAKILVYCIHCCPMSHLLLRKNVLQYILTPAAHVPWVTPSG
jgi:hypothetical protein